MASTPCLYHDLRLALATLYSLPHQHQSLSSQDAHNFLMEFQARNIRRKLQSLQQSQLDIAKRGGICQEDPVVEVETIKFGSSWLACLTVLMLPETHPSERLFCAQTLLHRLRRSKMNEAIDIEIESKPGVYHESTTMFAFKEWISAYHAPLGHFIANYFDTTRELPTSNLIQNEERIKCETSLVTLAFLVCQHSMKVDEHTTPLLTTLGGAMAAIALRLRYTPQSVAQNLPASSTPLVQMVLHSLRSVAPVSHDLSLSVCACLGAIPETILASPGGATGRLSIDPRCIAAAYEELRNPSTGANLLLQSLSGASDTSAILWTFERWAKYLPLPWEGFVEPSLAFVQHNLGHPSSIAYLMAIFEAAAKKPDDILTFALGIDAHNSQSSTKRQSSKSKRRQREFLEDASTHERRTDASAEFHHRGEIACKTAAVVWNDLRPIILLSPGGMACFCACANVCLPHWIRHYSTESHFLIQSILATFRDLCNHESRDIRAQTYEPLCSLASTMCEVSNSPLESLMIDHLFQSAMRLASSCGYPSDYFDFMARDNDDEIEIERNDVRDVLRNVCGGEDTYTGPPKSISLRVLDGIVRTCTESIMHQCDCNGLPHETAAHALSALAKPLNLVTEAFVRGELLTPDFIETFYVACRGYSFLAEKVLDALPKLPVSRVFPLSRLLNLGFASISPAFSALCRFEVGLTDEIKCCVRKVMHAAVASVVHIPELAVESTLEYTQFDIRGAFRSPGGEDHVGILVFMRLGNESVDLTSQVAGLEQEDEGSFLIKLCNLHDFLKRIEKERGPGVHHGKGVTPRTRRILLEAISRFTITAMSSPRLTSKSVMQTENYLQQLFHSTLVSIRKCGSHAIDAAALFHISEETFDLASLPPSLVSQLFLSSGEPFIAECVEVMMRAGMYGFERPLISDGPDGALIQWGRHRGALAAVIRASADPDLPEGALDAVIALTRAECQAIIDQCEAGPSSHSSIFCDEVISYEKLPAGVFLVILSCKLKEKNEVISGYLKALAGCCAQVLRAVVHPCPRPNQSVVDARPALCEAWFLVMSSFIDQSKAHSDLDGSEHLRHKTIAETCCAGFILIMYPSLQMDPKKRTEDLGISMDGAQTLALLEFYEKVLELGPERLQKLARELQSHLQVELNDEEDTTLKGMAIFGAILLRASSGGLAPWAVEYIPSTFAALFHGCGSNPQIFRKVVHASMHVRLIAGIPHAIDGLSPGSLLAGRFFQTMRQPNQEEFLAKVTEIATQDTADGWRRFKTLLKQATGGKKKAAGFNLKPSPTQWEFDRL